MKLASDKKYKVNLSHLSGDMKNDASQLVNEYKTTFASDTNRVGRFLPYKIQLRVSDDKDTKQSNRNINFQKHAEAREKIKYLISIGVMDYVQPDNPLTTISNFVLVHKTNFDGIRANSKADKQIARNQGALSYLSLIHI